MDAEVTPAPRKIWQPGPAPMATEPLPVRGTWEHPSMPGIYSEPPSLEKPKLDPPEVLELELPFAPLALKTLDGQAFRHQLQLKLGLLGWRKWGVAFEGPVEVLMTFN